MDHSLRKGINFDLDTAALQQHYPKKDWHNAYYDVRTYFEKNGFEHIQGSGYHSVEPMSEAKAMAVIAPLQMYLSCLTFRMFFGTESEFNRKRKEADPWERFR